MAFLAEFAVIFLIILIPGYAIPAGLHYWAYHVRALPENEPFRIQHRHPTSAGILREIRMSLVSILIFAALGTVLLQLYEAGQTSIYWRFRDYPIGYFPVSVFAAMVIHDTYFYWTHRLMHWRPIFKYVHAGHHRSTNPTPWAIFAFQPAEAIIQFVGMMGIVVFLPLHPLALLLFLALDTQMNTGGHTGFELVPRSVAESVWFRGFNTVTHHDAHHTHLGKNFGSFFNVWDRWMGTFLDLTTPPQPAAAAPERLPSSQPNAHCWQALTRLVKGRQTETSSR